MLKVARAAVLVAAAQEQEQELEQGEPAQALVGAQELVAQQERAAAGILQPLRPAKGRRAVPGQLILVPR